MEYISERLTEAMREVLATGQQVMLFINRRGHSPIVQCKKCGWAASCTDCSCGLAYHKKSGRLVCHVCGIGEDLHKICPDCKNEVSFAGVGIEKIEEEVWEKFPNVKTALVSSDTMANVGAMESLIGRIESGEVDVIIGTQILAKGHHFANLTLVGVIDADGLLYSTDFRAAEKTFQQLFQVAGRAGRGENRGRVLIQTYQPDHPVMQAIAANNRDEFVAKDMANRKAAGMPPFGQLIAVIIEHPNEFELVKFCNQLASAAPVINGGKILGPIPADIYQIRQWYRMRFLIMGGENAALQPVVEKWLAGVPQPKEARLKIDVSPQSFS